MQLPPETRRARVPLVQQLPMHELEFQTFDEVSKIKTFADGQPVLVNLWASWCDPCLRELGEIVRRADEIQAQGLDVRALADDGVGEDDTPLENAPQVIQQLGFPFTAARANAGILGRIQRLHNYQFSLHRDLPVPTSLLIDARGRLVAIYKGPVTVDEVLEDLSHADDDRAQRVTRATGRAGRSIDSPLFRSIADEAEARILIRYAAEMAAERRVQDVQRIYVAALQLMPDDPYLNYNVGALYSGLGQHELAARHIQLAVQLDPKLPYKLNHYGQHRADDGDLDQAVTFLRCALHAKPDYAEAACNLGLVLQLQGNTGEAVECFRQALEHQPEMTSAADSLA